MLPKHKENRTGQAIALIALIFAAGTGLGFLIPYGI